MATFHGGRSRATASISQEVSYQSPNSTKRSNPPHRNDVTSTRRVESSPVARTTFQSSQLGFSHHPFRELQSNSFSSSPNAFVDQESLPPIYAPPAADTVSLCRNTVPALARDVSPDALWAPRALTGPNITGLMLLAAVIVMLPHPIKQRHTTAVAASTHLFPGPIIPATPRFASHPFRPLQGRGTDT